LISAAAGSRDLAAFTLISGELIMSGYPANPSGLNAAGKKDDATIRDAKAGSPKGASGTYSDRPNAADPSKATIANNFVNKHTAEQPMDGSTADTGRKRP